MATTTRGRIDNSNSCYRVKILNSFNSRSIMGNSASNSTRLIDSTQHQAIVTHHPDGSKTIQLGRPLMQTPIVHRSPHPAVPGCQTNPAGNQWCSNGSCSVPVGSGFCCSSDRGQTCSGTCAPSTSWLNCERWQAIYPCAGCLPMRYD